MHATPSPTREAHRVLLAEGEPSRRDAALAWLRTLDLDVDVACDSEGAIAKLLQGRFDLALLAVGPDALDGLSVARALRTSGVQALAVIALAPSVDPRLAQACADAGINDLLAWPLDPAEWRETIGRWLPRRPPAPRPAPTPAPAPADVDLDASGALTRLLNDQALYDELLRRYADGQRKLPAQLRKAWDEKDIATAYRLAHSAKSVAAAVGAVRVQAQAAALERVFKAEPPDAVQVEAGLAALEECLQRVLQALAGRGTA